MGNRKTSYFNTKFYKIIVTIFNYSESPKRLSMNLTTYFIWTEYNRCFTLTFRSCDLYCLNILSIYLSVVYKLLPSSLGIFLKPAGFHYCHSLPFKYCFIIIARPHQLYFLIWFLFLISSFNTIWGRTQLPRSATLLVVIKSDFWAWSTSDHWSALSHLPMLTTSDTYFSQKCHSVVDGYKTQPGVMCPSPAGKGLSGRRE